ncbi:hypothetical protein ACSQ67_000649 [Phaseolus vulgaris]
MDEPCGYPRICLSCTENNQTMLAIRTMKLLVSQISYRRQVFSLTDPENCFSNKFNQTINFIRSYQFESPYERPHNNLSFFNCTSAENPHLRHQYEDGSDSQDMVSCPIYIFNSFESVLQLDLTSCTKMFDLTAPIPSLESGILYLRWPKPNCAECKGKRNRCTWKTNNSTGDIDCFECKPKRIHVPKSFIFASTVNRPSIKSVIHMLETEDENQLVVPPNPFHSTTSTTAKGLSSTRLPLQLEVIQE